MKNYLIRKTIHTNLANDNSISIGAPSATIAVLRGAENFESFG